MSKKFRSALKGMKDTYPSPNPEREAAFLRSLPTKEVKKKRLPFLHTANKPFWYSIPAVVTAAVLITVGTGVYQHMGHHNLPSIELPAETQTTTVDGQIYETQQTSASTEHNTNAPPSSDFEEYVHTDTSIDTHTNISTNSSTDVNILQTDATEAPYVPEKTDSAVLETTYITQTSGKTTVPHQTVTTAVPVTTVPQTTPDRNDTPVPQTTPKATTAQSDTPPTVIAPTLPPPDDPEPTEGCVPEPTMQLSTDPMQVYSDYRVIPAQKYSIIGNVYEWTGSGNVHPPEDTTTNMPPCTPQAESWQELASKADVIVRVQVDTLYYTLAGNEPYTQIDATVVGTYKGSLKFGDLISVYEKGGYIPVDAYQSICPDLEENLAFMQGGTLFVAGEASVQVQTEEVYLLFLNYAQDPDVPEGAFVYADNANLSRCLKESVSQFTAMNDAFSVKLSDLLQFTSTNSRISVQLPDWMVNSMFSVQLLDWLLDGTFSVQLTDLLQS